MGVKWVTPVNRNMIATARSPAAFHEERRLTPSSPTALRTRNEITRMNRGAIYVLLSARTAVYRPPLTSRPSVGHGGSLPFRGTSYRPPTDHCCWPGSRLALLHVLSTPPSLFRPKPIFRTGSQSASRRGLKPPALLPHYSRTSTAGIERKHAVRMCRLLPYLVAGEQVCSFMSKGGHAK